MHATFLEETHLYRISASAKLPLLNKSYQRYETISEGLTAASSCETRLTNDKMSTVHFTTRFSLVVLFLLLLHILVLPFSGAGAGTGKTTINLFNRALSSNAKQQEEALSATNLRGAANADEAVDVNVGKKHGTVCIYQGSSCTERAQGKPGRFASCNSEVEDDICMNFPTAGVVFKCASEDNLSIYPTAGCASKRGVSQQVACVDMTLGTYFLLCCMEKGSKGEPCNDGTPTVLNTQEAQEPTWMGGKFVKW